MIKRIVLGVVTAMTLAACGSDGSHEGHEDNTDPRAGWVEFQPEAWKVCDGTIMIYHTSSGSSNVPNHRECGGTSGAY